MRCRDVGELEGPKFSLKLPRTIRPDVIIY